MPAADGINGCGPSLYLLAGVFPQLQRVPDPPNLPTDLHWSARWAHLAHSVGLDPRAPVVCALSGGADSVLLLHLIAAATPRPAVWAVHVQHGLRGSAGEADAQFCRELAADLGLPFVLRTLDLDPDPRRLEARARQQRYAALASEARRLGVQAVVTGHHADDALETLLLRWMRGTHPMGAGGLRSRMTMEGASLPVEGLPENRSAAPNQPSGAPLTVARPLIGLRREEVRTLLRSRGLTWRRDASNQDPRFARNRLRETLLPALSRSCEPEHIENLLDWAGEVERLEEGLARETAHIGWKPEPLACAPDTESGRVAFGGPGLAAPQTPAAQRTGPPPGGGILSGGWLARRDLMVLPSLLRIRVLRRLLLEGCGRGVGARNLRVIDAEIAQGRVGRHALPRDYVLVLRAARVHLIPPAEPAHQPQLQLPFPHAAAQAGGLLQVPGTLDLGDGRRLTARWILGDSERLSRDPHCVDLAGGGWSPSAPLVLTVRPPRPGDRFHPLGAPGRRPLGRFLGGAGVPRELRRAVPLVFSGEELLWVAGLRPSEQRRVRTSAAPRVRLTLERS